MRSRAAALVGGSGFRVRVAARIGMGQRGHASAIYFVAGSPDLNEQRVTRRPRPPPVGTSPPADAFAHSEKGSAASAPPCSRKRSAVGPPLAMRVSAKNL